MLKKSLSFVFVVLLLNAFSFNSVYAASNAEKEARYAAKVKANVVKLGTGKEARIEVKLRDKTKLKGYVSQISESGFTVIDEATGAATKVPYPNAKQVKGNNLSTGVKVALGIGIAIAAVVLICVISPGCLG